MGKNTRGVFFLSCSWPFLTLISVGYYFNFYYNRHFYIGLPKGFSREVLLELFVAACVSIISRIAKNLETRPQKTIAFIFSVTSATLCDGIVASERATFSTPFARLGENQLGQL